MFDRAKQEKRKRRMHENMDIYKSQQISRLRERCKNQVSQKVKFTMFIFFFFYYEARLGRKEFLEPVTRTATVFLMFCFCFGKKKKYEQMNRIKNNCSIQVEWMKDNYIESMNNNSHDHRASYLTNQYNEQVISCNAIQKVKIKIFFFHKQLNFKVTQLIFENQNA